MNSSIDSFLIEPGLLFQGSLSGTITAGHGVPAHGGSDSLSILSNGDFTLANALVTYGANSTGLSGNFGTVALSATTSGNHNFDISLWDGTLGTVFLTGGSGTGINTLIDNTTVGVQLNNSFLQDSPSNALFFLTNFQAATITDMSASGVDLDISGWTGSRTVSLTGIPGETILGVSDGSSFVLSDGSLTRSVGGAATLSGITRAAITELNTKQTITLSGWTGTGFIVGALDNTTTLIDDDFTGNNLTLVGNPAGTGILTSGSQTLALANITNAILQTLSTTPGVTIDASGFAGSTTLVGGSGNDHLIAGPGNSILLGNGGNEVLTGGTGYDILVAGTGNNSLTSHSAAGFGSILDRRSPFEPLFQ